MTDNAAFDDRPLKERIKQRREQGGEIGVEGSLSAEAADYAFGYGGWSQIVDKPPATASFDPMMAATDPVGAGDPADMLMPAAPATEESIANERLRERLRARSVQAAAEFAAQEQAAAGMAPTAGGRRSTDEDRPIIAAPPPARRPLTPANDLRAEAAEPRNRRSGSRRSRRERTQRDKLEEAGARMRRAQRIEGGGTVMIGDALFPLVDWSTGGIAIASEGQRYRVGERTQLELELDLGDYAVNLDLMGEVMNRSAERTGWRFVDPTERQREVLRSITLASLHGRAFTAPTGTVRGAERASKREGGRRRRFSPLAAVMSLPFNAAVIALVAGAAILIVEEGTLPTLEAEPPAASLEPVRAAHAAVAVERAPLVSDRTGSILEWGVSPGDSVDNGEALVSVELDDAAADRDVIESPCDCYVARILAESGTTVSAGDTIALLYPRGADGHIQALFAPGTAPNIGDAVTVDLPYSGDTFPGVVESVGRLEDPQLFIGLPNGLATGGTVYARIATTPPVPAALAGDPAIVTVEPRS